MSVSPAAGPVPALEHASVGAPINRMGVSLFPVYVHQPLGQRIRTGREAGFSIAEADDETVPTLVASNLGAEPLLLVEGETLAGGLQQRTLNVSVLMGAHRTVAVPVSCVEAGRWGGSRDFSGSTGQTSRRVRRAKAETVRNSVRRTGDKLSDQAAVWDSVDRELELKAAPSPTRNLADAEVVFERSGDLAAALEELVGTGPLPGQCGVVVGHGSRVVSAEVFADADMFAAHWEPIVRASLLDRPARLKGRPSASRALGFLRRMAKEPAVETEGVDLGRERHLESRRLVGQALTWEDRLVHASAFALAA